MAKWLKKQILARDGNRCRYCMKQVHCRDPLHKDFATLEHIIPKSRGGRLVDDNVAISCLECNRRKGSRLESEMQKTTDEPPMDKQQAAREAFEKWGCPHLVINDPSNPPKLMHDDCGGYYYKAVDDLWFSWQAAQAALMPTLAEARDALIYVEANYDGMNKADIPMKALARLNAVIGDKK